MTRIVSKSKYVATILFENESGSRTVCLGSRVKKGNLIFQLKYLNLMLKFYAPFDCIIDDIYIGNKSIVQYGTRIMAIVSI